VRKLRICYQVPLAVRARNDRRVAHLNIKPQNILMDRRGGAKLADINLSLMPVPGRGLDGTSAFIAPDVAQSGPHDTFKADMQSLGVTLFYTALGELPSYSRPEDIIKTGECGFALIPDAVPWPLAQIRVCLIRETRNRGR
jgi:serine/threonine protein kinase